MKLTDKDVVASAEAIKTLRDNWPLFLDHSALQAEMAKAKFDALVKQGFSEAQAIDLLRQAMT